MKYNLNGEFWQNEPKASLPPTVNAESLASRRHIHSSGKLHRSQVVLRLALPELGASVVPAGSYPSLTRHYQTVGLYNFVVAHRTLPDDLVYGIAEAVFANHDEMMQA